MLLFHAPSWKRSCLNVIQQDWFCVSSQKKACPETVEGFLSMCRHVSPAVLTHVANMADRNGNTALHYSVSHSNFRVVQKLLDAGTHFSWPSKQIFKFRNFRDRNFYFFKQVSRYLSCCPSNKKKRKSSIICCQATWK